jgi:hypothetical protein
MKQQFRLGDVTKIKDISLSSHGLENGIFVKVTSVEELPADVLAIGGLTRARIDELPITDGISYGVRVVFEDETNPLHQHERWVSNLELEVLP